MTIIPPAAIDAAGKEVPPEWARWKANDHD